MILFGFSIYLIKLLETGEIQKLVSPHIQMLLTITLAVLLVMTFYALSTIFTKETSHAHAHDHTNCNHSDHDHRPKPRKSWLLLITPVVLGLAIPTHSLGASMLGSGLQSKLQARYTVQDSSKQPQVSRVDVAQTNGTNPTAIAGKTLSLNSTTAPSNSTASATASTGSPVAATAARPDFVDLNKLPKVTVPDTDMPPKPTPGSELALADLFSYIMVAPEYYFNQNFKVTGFVYHPPGWATNRMIIVRYLITCCTADATPIGLTVEMNDATKYKDNNWVEVDGLISTRKVSDADSIVPISWYYGPQDKPVLIGHAIEEIPEPKDPYTIPTKPGSTGGK